MARNLKHRPVIEIEGSKDIAQEPKMKELKTLLTEMDNEERQRTIEYLDKKDQGRD